MFKCICFNCIIPFISSTFLCSMECRKYIFYSICWRSRHSGRLQWKGIHHDERLYCTIYVHISLSIKWTSTNWYIHALHHLPLFEVLMDFIHHYYTFISFRFQFLSFLNCRDAKCQSKIEWIVIWNFQRLESVEIFILSISPLRSVPLATLTQKMSSNWWQYWTENEREKKKPKWKFRGKNVFLI